jgi:hypothetical protein
MASELGFDLVTTVIAFIATFGSRYCCGSPIYLGPLPLSTTIPFFLLILTEFVFLARAILLTLWPSKFAATSASCIGGDDDDDDDDAGSSSSKTDEEGFEVKLGGKEDDGTTSSNNDEDLSDRDENDKKEEQTVVDVLSNIDKQPITSSGRQDVNTPQVSSSKGSSGSSKSHSTIADGKKNNQVYRKEEEPVFVEGKTRGKEKKRRSGTRTAICCCFEWNAKMILTALGILTLLNPIFACVIAWMLLYQSNRVEAFVVLGLEAASILLHFVGVRLEGGLRTWKSKLLHSFVLLPFLVTVIVVLVYLREGGVCYSVESEIFLFSGCEVCVDGTPPVNGQCGNITVIDGSSFGGLVNVDEFDITNLGALAERGMTQDTYCSSEGVNFCFYPF